MRNFLLGIILLVLITNLQAEEFTPSNNPEKIINVEAAEPEIKVNTLEPNPAILDSTAANDPSKIITSSSTESISKIPMKAAVLSLFIPGCGQYYNESYWKATGILALEGGLIGLAIYHNYKSDEYYDKFLNTESPTYYSEYIKFYDKRQSDFWWIGTVIFLSTIDAYVDAHLFDFDKKKSKLHLIFEENMLSLQYKF